MSFCPEILPRRTFRSYSCRVPLKSVQPSCLSCQQLQDTRRWTRDGWVQEHLGQYIALVLILRSLLFVYFCDEKSCSETGQGWRLLRTSTSRMRLGLSKAFNHVNEMIGAPAMNASIAWEYRNCILFPLLHLSMRGGRRVELANACGTGRSKTSQLLWSVQSFLCVCLTPDLWMISEQKERINQPRSPRPSLEGRKCSLQPDLHAQSTKGSASVVTFVHHRLSLRQALLFPRPASL